jgi:hypothetical protein
MEFRFLGSFVRHENEMPSRASSSAPTAALNSLGQGGNVQLKTFHGGKFETSSNLQNKNTT